MIGALHPAFLFESSGAFYAVTSSWLCFAISFVVYYRHHNCQSPRCIRIGKHPAAGGLFKLCRKHHPDVPNKGASLKEIHVIHDAHREANR